MPQWLTVCSALPQDLSSDPLRLPMSVDWQLPVMLPPVDLIPSAHLWECLHWHVHTHIHMHNNKIILKISVLKSCGLEQHNLILRMLSNWDRVAPSVSVACLYFWPLYLFAISCRPGLLTTLIVASWEHLSPFFSDHVSPSDPSRSPPVRIFLMTLCSAE